MRVCHVVECGGGVGNVIVDLVRASVDAGDEVTVIYGKARAWPRFLQALMAMQKVTLVASTMRRSVGIHDLLDAIRLYSILRRYAPFDIIHAHSSKAGALVRLLRPLLGTSVVIYTPHAFMTLAPEASPIYGWIERLLGYFCDAIICLSREEKLHAVEKLKIPQQKLRVIPNGIDTTFSYDRSGARAEFNATDSDFIVGFIGRLEAQKNPLRAVAAFAEAADARPNLRMVIIGQGPLQVQTEKAIATHGIKDRVSFHAGFNGRGLAAGFDCLLCSSDYEGFGLVVLEALAAGVPVVMTPVGASEAVVPGETGFVASNFTSHVLAFGIAEVADSNVEQRVRAFAAAKAQAEKFSQTHMVNTTRELYTTLLSQKRGSNA